MPMCHMEFMSNLEQRHASMASEEQDRRDTSYEFWPKLVSGDECGAIVWSQETCVCVCVCV